MIPPSAIQNLIATMRDQARQAYALSQKAMHDNGDDLLGTGYLATAGTLEIAARSLDALLGEWNDPNREPLQPASIDTLVLLMETFRRYANECKERLATVRNDEYLRGLMQGYANAYELASGTTEKEIYAQRVREWDAALKEMQP